MHGLGINMTPDMYAILPTQVKPRRIQPGRRTIMVSVLLSLMLLVAQLMRALQLNRPPKLEDLHIIQSIASMNEEAEIPTCVKIHLGPSVHHTRSHAQTCQHLPAPRGLCSLVHKLFFSTRPPDCQHQQKVVFCSTKSGDIECSSPSQCAGLEHFVGFFGETEAKLKWQRTDKENLRSALLSVLERANSFGFVFIRCSENISDVEDLGQPQYDENYEDVNSNSHTQLFMYPRKLSEKTRYNGNKNININMVMIDSLSRNHFYRSLPKAIKYLESLYERTNRTVLDFQYLQAIKQRTYESLEALFTGYVNMTEIPFGTYDIPKKTLPLSHLFGLYKKKGYKTLWLEDLCWNWEWGLVKDLKVMNESLDTSDLWQKFKEALSNANIDAIDLTVASCYILEANGKKDPFHDVPAVCFNGQHHHEYLLQYLQLYQNSVQGITPFVTFTVTDVAHDETGVRVQALDESLTEYLKFASQLDNTVTILFSDHGSTYGKFIQSSPEAYVETFNPFLFIIIPHDVQKALGNVQMKILRDNEKRLISLIDVHGMLIQLLQEKEKVPEKKFASKYVNPGGLMSSIPLRRNCNNIPLLQPNLCICKNFETSVEPTDVHMALADFGLGVLNNLILEQHKQSGSTGFGSCRPLQALNIRKVHEIQISADKTKYKLDIVVNGTQTQFDNGREIFFLILEAGSGNSFLRLVSYERMSLYGVFSSCRDPSVELKLCVCNTDRSNNRNGLLSSFLFGSLFNGFNFIKNTRAIGNQQITDFISNSVLGTKAKLNFSYPTHNPCLFTIIHRFKTGIVLMASNFCQESHVLEILMETENLNLSCENHPKFLLNFGDVKMLLGGIVSNPKRAWHWDYSVNIQ